MDVVYNYRNIGYIWVILGISNRERFRSAVTPWKRIGLRLGLGLRLELW